MITIVSRSVFLRPHRQPPRESDCLLSITNDSSDSRSFKTDTYGRPSTVPLYSTMLSALSRRIGLPPGKSTSTCLIRTARRRNQ
jgi:hypothetical protein